MGDQFDVMVPVRVDLSGGWTDVNPYCTDFGGEVVNFTINKYVKANINLSGEVSYNFDIPVGSGLGTSGSVNVARIALLRKSENLSLNEIAEAFMNWANFQTRFTKISNSNENWIGNLYEGETNLWIYNDGNYLRLALSNDLDFLTNFIGICSSEKCNTSF